MRSLFIVPMLVSVMAWAQPVLADNSDKDVFHKFPPDIQRQADELVSKAGMNPQDVKVYYSDDDLWNGVTWNEGYLQGAIGISYGVFRASQTVRGDDRLFLVVLAHELGHVVHDIDTPGTGPVARDRERQADYYGIHLLYTTGYGCEIAVQAAETMPPFSQSSSHPSTQERRDEARYICDSLEKTGQMPNDLYFETGKLKDRY